VEQVQPHGPLPTARAYHTFNTMGNKCFVVGGRTTQNTLLTRDELLCMYDVATNQWVSPGPVSGTFPARSSHRGIVIGGNQLVICGGTGQGKVRMNDTSVLKQASNGQIVSMKTCHQRSTCAFALSHAKCSAWSVCYTVHRSVSSLYTRHAMNDKDSSTL